MYVAKRSRRGVMLYHPEADRHSLARLALASELRQALELGDLSLHYQPKVALATGLPVGVEALARWPHPKQGWFRPITSSSPRKSYSPMTRKAGRANVWGSSIHRLTPSPSPRNSPPPPQSEYSFRLSPFAWSAATSRWRKVSEFFGNVVNSRAMWGGGVGKETL